MENIKKSWIIKFLTGKDIKTKSIKLAIVLALMSFTFLDTNLCYIAFTFCTIYVALEFSADSIFWLILTGMLVPYISVVFVHMLMWEFIAVLLIYLITDIVKKRINYKSWQFITLISLFVVLALLILLPLAKTYSFSLQLKRLSLFAVVVLSMIYIKQINIKHTLLLIVVLVISFCVMFMIAEACGAEYAVNTYKSVYSKGMVERFGAFNGDPNFTGATLICAIASWFFLYRKNYVNKYWYFAILAVMGYFALTTISKATYLVVAIFALYVIIENIIITIKTKNIKHLLELLWYGLVLLFVCGIGWKYVNAMYQRIFNTSAGMWSEGDNMSMTNLTTGRSDIWIGYIKEIFGSWKILLFGAGAAAEMLGRPAHSLPIEYLYRYGILGVLVILAICVVCAWPYLKRVKPYSFVPFVLIMLIFSSIGSISAKYIYIFEIILLTISFNGVEYEKLNQDTEINFEKDLITK